ncbi:hypothetical protein RMCBS344292_03238 [Rhizopus microsporus]|nr:hypothetical protein RMCBS344292_03238 [Rhizopus microsporus]
MAPLQVIGAGFGRTGTDSLRMALEMLGYRTHHMSCFIKDPNLDPLPFKEAYLNNKQGDWDTIYKDFDAAVDWPTCTFYKELMEKYPDAKVILTVRTPESWYKSVMNTIVPISSDVVCSENPTLKRIGDMCHTVIFDGLFVDKERINNEKYVKQLFIDHNEEVKRTVPPERLLVMELGEGWERLCKFLDKKVPDQPYPKANSTEEFIQRAKKAMHEK